MHMEGLPVEIIEKISKFACTDGGRTGCSLSLTSRYIREATRTTRFHSISLLSMDATKSNERIIKFTLLFHAERAALFERTTPRLRHLCILIAAPSAVELCRTCAPDLHTLMLARNWPASEYSTMSGVEFPLLKELSILGSGLEFGEVYSHPSLPSLTRLHITPIPQLTHYQAAPNLRLWSARAPHVTHLHVSLVNDTNVLLRAELANLVAPELKGLPLMFPDMERAVVQLSGSRTTTPTSFEEWEALVEPFLEGSPVTRPLVIHPQKSGDLDMIRSDMERDWLERVAGVSGTHNTE